MRVQQTYRERKPATIPVPIHLPVLIYPAFLHLAALAIKPHPKSLLRSDQRPPDEARASRASIGSSIAAVEAMMAPAMRALKATPGRKTCRCLACTPRKKSLFAFNSHDHQWLQGTFGYNIVWNPRSLVQFSLVKPCMTDYILTNVREFDSKWYCCFKLATFCLQPTISLHTILVPHIFSSETSSLNSQTQIFLS